jgi:hypothetical protein
LGADSRFSELEYENAADSQCCQDLFFKLQTEGKVNWSPAHYQSQGFSICKPDFLNQGI